MEELEEVEIVRNGSDDGDEKVRVLVVDDSPVDRKVVDMLLKWTDALFEVISADNGMKAMQILGLNEANAVCPAGKGQKIDIILTDYCMPEMTGYDLLKKVKENDCPRSIPVVIMSSENDPQRIKRCLAVGAEDFFLKPLKAQDAQKLKQYATLTGPTLKVGTKSKLPIDMITDAKTSAGRPRLAGVAVG
ncbi:putative response regulator and transcription factor RR-A-type family [Dioscorea sansibarensis]